jgi:aryl-alcohol dehydrogenase-like predicted oxidoreductase
LFDNRSALSNEMARRFPEEYLYGVVDALDAVSAETGKSVPQVALNLLLQRPSVLVNLARGGF